MPVAFQCPPPRHAAIFFVFLRSDRVYYATEYGPQVPIHPAGFVHVYNTDI